MRFKKRFMIEEIRLPVNKNYSQANEIKANEIKDIVTRIS